MATLTLARTLALGFVTFLLMLPETLPVPVLKGLRHAGYANAVSIEMKRPAGGLDDVRQAAVRLAAAHRSVEAAHA